MDGVHQAFQPDLWVLQPERLTYLPMPRN